MKLIRQLSDIGQDLRQGAVAIGNFDGVHLGHATLIRRLVAHAHHLEGAAVIFTFEPHPVRLLRPELAPPPLTWTERKAALLSELGVDALIAYPTDTDLLALSPQAFFTQIITRSLAARAVVEGPNFYFGKDRAGDVACSVPSAARRRSSWKSCLPYSKVATPSPAVGSDVCSRRDESRRQRPC